MCHVPFKQFLFVEMCSNIYKFITLTNMFWKKKNKYGFVNHFQPLVILLQDQAAGNNDPLMSGQWAAALMAATAGHTLQSELYAAEGKIKVKNFPNRNSSFISKIICWKILMRLPKEV